MRDQDQLTVNLAKKTTSVTVPLDPGRTLQHFQSVETRWISLPELQGIGVINPTDAIRVLQEQGAVIEIMYKDMVTSNYQIHEDAPHYRYLGWHIDANSPASISGPKSSSASMENNLKDISMENKGPMVETPSVGEQTQRIAELYKRRLRFGSLTAAPAKVLETLRNAGEQGATSKELEQQCGVSPSNAVSELRACGAWIDTYPTPYTFYRGVRHCGEGRYVFRGWDPEAPSKFRELFPKKES